jgi:hypothetical protein
VEDPNTTQDVLDKFSTFEIIVMWELDFVKIVRMSKKLNNKDCNLLTNHCITRACHMLVEFGFHMIGLP